MREVARSVAHEAAIAEVNHLRAERQVFKARIVALKVIAAELLEDLYAAGVKPRDPRLEAVGSLIRRKETEQ